MISDISLGDFEIFFRSVHDISPKKFTMMSLEVDPPGLVKTKVYRPDLDLGWRWGDPGT